MQCILCGGSVRALFSARDYQRPEDHTEYRLNWCDECRFGRLAGNFTPEAVRKFYDFDYYTHGPVESSAAYRAFLERLRVHLSWRLDYGVPFDPRELGEPTGRTVCDIGCGAGNVLRVLKSAGFRVVGVEPDAKARARAVQVAEVLDGTAECLPPEIEERQFDVVIMTHVLEHCIDPAAALENISAILAEDGRLIIEVPNNAAAGFTTFGPYWPWSDIPRHINFFPERSLRTLVRKSDSEIKSVHYVGFTRQFSPSWIRAQNEIWQATNKEEQADFDIAAWLLLLRTAFTSAPAKYDSVRVHASRGLV